MTMIQNNERLILKATNIRALQGDDKDTNTIQGDAIVYGQPSQPMDNFTEIVDSGALNDVDTSNVFLLLDHDYSKVIAKNGVNMTLNNDDTGLHFTADLDTSISYVSDVFSLITQGIINSMSFGFTLPDDGSGEQWSQDDNGDVVRLITQIDQLFEISVVTIPAYSETDVSVATRSYEKFISENNKKDAEKRSKENKNMEKTIIKPETIEDKAKKELRSFEDYIRSHGEKRDLKTTDANGKAIVPQQLVTPLFKPAKGDYNLAQYVTVKNVTSSQGTYPVATNSNAILQTKAENTQVADADVNIKSVQFNTPERMGRVLVSNELLSDNSVDLASEVQDQLGDLVQNTTNKLIMDVINTATVKTVTSLDDIKNAKNGLNPWLKNKIVLLNTDSFSYLDTLKDSEGKYLIQPNVQDGFAGTLFGIPVVVLDDTLLPTPSTGLPIIIGDLSEAVVLFERQQISATYQQFDSWSTGILAGVRQDAEPINFDGNLVNMVLTTATAAGK